MQQTADWLEKLGLGQYAQRFAENDINFVVLSDLTDQDLEEIGVTSLRHRRQLLRAIGELDGVEKGTPKPATLATAPVAPHDTAERRQVTVMFSDIVGSTALSASMDPEDLREVIAAYQKGVAETVRRLGGFVANYMGDGVLVYFGYPQAHEDDAERAVRAGLELVEAMPKLTTAAGLPLQVRVGIATGLVVVGDLVGMGAKQEQAVVGETPYIAARLQGIAEPNTVAIAESTRKLLGNLFDLQDLGAKDLKGIVGPVRASAALRPSAVETRFEALHATCLTALVGREEELELLLRRWSKVKIGEGQVVLLSGEAGIGKSRLTAALLEKLTGEPHTRLRFFCSPHYQDSALYPTITQLERAARFRREDTAEERLAKLEALLAQATNDIRQVVPLIADLLSIPTGERYPTLAITPQKRKEKTLQALVAQAEGLAVRQPVLMIFEDVHWSDPSTREWLDLLIEQVTTVPLLIIITFRPEFSPPWIGRPQVTLLTLNRLEPAQCAEMIAQVTGGKTLPKEIANRIIDRTDGVPLFIEELTKSVVESGVLTETGDGYTVTGPVARLAIPTTLHASLMARLDRLAPTREVAQIAAALGRQFTHELISAIALIPQQQLDDALAQLVRAELIFRRGTPPDAEYTFKHALVQDAAYGSLLRSRRLQLHARIVATLEDHFPKNVAAQPVLLAQHCAEAGLAEKALVYWLKAGQQAIARSATTEAEEGYRQARAMLNRLPESPERDMRELELCSGLVGVLQLTRGYSAPQTVEAGERVRALAEKVGNLSQLVRQEERTWGAILTTGDYAGAAAIADRLLDLAQRQRQGHDTKHLVLAHDAQVQTRFYSGDLIGAEEHFARLSGLIQTVGLRPAPGITPITIGVTGLGAWALGRADSARERIARTVAFAQNSKRPYDLAMALLFESYLYRFQREPERAETAATQLLSLSEEHGFSYACDLARGVTGWARAQLGRTGEGVSLIRQALAGLAEKGARVGNTDVLTRLAEAQALDGAANEALDTIEVALKTNPEELVFRPNTLKYRGELRLKLGQNELADADFRDAIAMAQRMSAKAWELRAAMSMARLWRDQGKRKEAHDLLAPVYGWFTEGFDTVDLKEAKELLSELVSVPANVQQALNHWGRSRAAKLRAYRGSPAR
ncbi:MAG TPA: adenylate/guanylate cyclase domain-containing protein [Steroidobacteraceae bacterium]|nr:adenylate/guanylate cyclase domain-containing protein [Steroidobacteraceae bacterium]